jgi:hypothetical protein
LIDWDAPDWVWSPDSLHDYRNGSTFRWFCQPVLAINDALTFCLDGTVLRFSPSLAVADYEHTLRVTAAATGDITMSVRVCR